MKLLAYVLIAFTVLLIIEATRQQISGRADVLAPGRSIQRFTAERDSQPEQYKNLMTYQWIRAVLPGCAALFLLHLIRRQDQLDPLSDSFQGSAAVDELGKYLDDQKKNKNG